MAKPLSTTAKKANDEYIIRSPFIGVAYNHNLTQTEFYTLKKAREFLTEYLRFEESLLQVLYSEEEFEAFLLSTSLNHYLFPGQKHDFLQDTRLRSNLKVLGLLNSITSLRDQFPKFKVLLPAINLHSNFKKLWDAQKSTSVAFKFCERFRNYAQHQTQPVSSAMTGGGWDKNFNLLESHLSLFVNVNSVCKNHSIEAAEQQQYISAFGNKCDISLLFREAMGCIGKIITEIRATTDGEFQSAISCYESHLKIAKQNNSPASEVTHLKNGSAVETFTIFQDFSDRAKRLRRTYVMTNNEKHFISNRARGHGN
jgi:hypothetical protein